MHVSVGTACAKVLNLHGPVRIPGQAGPNDPAMSSKKIPLQDLDWDDLRVFLAVYRLGSLSQTARRMRLDHSTVSRRLAQLELSLGGALFERQRSGLKATELAATIHAHAETMEGAMIALRESLGGEAREPSGSVRVAMMEGIGSMFVARRLKPLHDRHPKLRVELVTSPSHVNVSRREADVFLSFFKPAGRGLHSHPVGTFRLSLYGSDAYFSEHGRPASVTELADHRFCGYIDDLVQVDAVRWLDEVITNPQLSFQSNSMIAQMTAAASGAGLVLLPRFSVVRESELQPVLEDEVRVSREIWISVHHDLQYSTRIRTVIDYLNRLLTSEQAWLNGAA